MINRLRLWDVLVPALIWAVGTLELVGLRPVGWQWGILLEGVSMALMVGRRFWPLATGILASVILLYMPFAGPQLNDVATPILALALIAYSFARWIPDFRGLIGIGAILLVFLADYLLADSRSHDFSDVIFVCALVFPPYAFGRITRRLALQSEQLRRQQELIRDQAVRDERDRIARELHDVIAHSLSAMVVQTAAAQDLVRVAPERASELLQSVADTGRKALDETGRLLHLIRDDGDELGLSPAPGLADVPALVTRFGESGLEVEADLDLPAVALPGGVDVSAYRVVQEALTNALKYGDGRARLVVASTAERLWIQCVNDVGAGRVSGSGLGLQGMAERVEMLGGTLLTGVQAGSYALDVDIPLVRGGGHVTTVVVADDQELVRSGLQLVLEARGCEVVGVAGDGREALDVVRRTEPDVVLMDIRMPVMDGIAATRRLSEEGSPSKVLVLTTYDLDRYVYDALGAGAAGFLLKATPPDRLVEGIRTVCAGESLLAPNVTRRLIEEFLRHPPPDADEAPGLSALTDRERQVLVLMARGLTNDDIAAHLVVAQATVKTHINRVLAKLGVATRVQAVVLAYESGLVRPGG